MPISLLERLMEKFKSQCKSFELRIEEKSITNEEDVEHLRLEIEVLMKHVMTAKYSQEPKPKLDSDIK